MAGFFKSSKLQSVQGPQRSCIQCGLSAKGSHPKTSYQGKGGKGIFILGQSPTVRADKKDMPLEGAQRKLLIATLRKHGIDLERDCILMNSVNCCCGIDKNRDPLQPSSVQIESCRSSIQKQYKKHKPKLIFLMGSSAAASHWDHRWKGSVQGISHWRGWHIPDHYFNVWTIPIFHPEYLLKEKTPDVAKVILKNDISAALKLLDKPLPAKIDEDCVEIFLKEKDALYYLNNLWNDPPEYLCFDYETTGLKPHHPGHKIVCCGIATERGDAVAFFLTKKTSYYLKKILSKTPSKKIAQNMKFEETWTRYQLGTRVNNWYFDPMLASHVLDNRTGTKGLKFQAFVQFGITDYDSEVSRYLKSKEGSNGFNTIHKAPRRDLLIYCGMDALIEFRLAMKQMEEIGLKKGISC